MSLSENFQEMIEPMNKTAIAGFALVAAFSLSGCASGHLNLPQGNVGAIPVGRVINQNTNQNVYTAKKAIRDEAAAAIRLTPCPTAATTAPAEPGVMGWLKKSIMPTQTVSIGDPTCGKAQQVDQNGVGPRPTR